jgi:hypothetical protein
MITARLPQDARVLVTCSRNVAVESIAQKVSEWASERAFPVDTPSKPSVYPGGLPLSYSGNPGVIGDSYRGANGKRLHSSPALRATREGYWYVVSY